MWIVVGESALRSLLLTHGQAAWVTPYRIKGLLLLIDYFARHDGRKGVPLAHAVARGYISKLEGEQPPGTVLEPLHVLCKIKIMEVTAKAVIAPHIKASTAYRLTERYRKLRHEETIDLSPKLAGKLANASARREKGLNRRYPHRKGVSASLRLLELPSSARMEVEKMKTNPDLRPSVERVLHAVDAQDHIVKITERGHIRTSLSSCPRELKPLLQIGGEPIVACDISHAHHCFLPRFIAGRIVFLKRDGASPELIERHEAERQAVIGFLSDGDYYRKWCVNPDDDAEREQKKTLVTVLLNQSLPKCEGNALYAWMHSRFPLTFGVIDDLKRKDHRNISKQTQALMAEAMRLALLEMQARGFPAIPDTDAILCQQQHRIAACYFLGAAMFTVSGGVKCKVGGLRFQTRAEMEELVAWDEERHEDPPMDYDAWEEKRSHRAYALALANMNV